VQTKKKKKTQKLNTAFFMTIFLAYAHIFNTAKTLKQTLPKTF